MRRLGKGQGSTMAYAQIFLDKANLPFFRDEIILANLSVLLL